MPWTPVDSTMLSAVDYDPAMRVLHLRFERGDVVSYSDVPPEVAAGLTGAESAGRYYNKTIKGRYRAL